MLFWPNLRHFTAGVRADETPLMAIVRKFDPDPALSSTATARPLLTVAEVMVKTTYSRPSLYRLLAEGKFPAPLKLGANRIALVAEEIDRWLATRPRAGANSSEASAMTNRCAADIAGSATGEVASRIAKDRAR